jgi:hypothetical protein
VTSIGGVEVDVHSPHLVMAGDPVDLEALPSIQREAMVRIVRDALERMAVSVEEWLPGQVLASSNDRFGIVIHWHNRFLDDEIIRLHAEAERDSEQRLADLKRMAGRHGGADSSPE